MVTSEKRREYFKKYYARNRKKYQDYAKAWWKAHPEKRAAKNRRKYLRHRDQIRARTKIWKKNNPDKVREFWRNDTNAKERSRLWYIKNRERMIQKQRKYHKDHPEVCLDSANKRRALKKSSAINLAGIRAWIKQIKSKPTAICYWCQERFPTDRIHFDHIIALSKGGPHSIDNLCVACEDCNRTKHAKSVRAFIRIGQQFLEL